MGVHGWTRFLSQRGWLPDRTDDRKQCGCVTSCWRDPQVLHHEFAGRIKAVPNGSMLHVDGYGLAFYLYEVAYERFVQSILGCSPCHISPRDAATRGDLQRLIPVMMPLALIEQVTQEYVMGLLSRFKVVVHFDGNGRRRIHSSQPTTAPRDCNSEPMSHSKQETTQIRKTAILDTWQNLLFYVKTGGFPTSKTICSWRRDFPRPRLLIEQIQQTLQSMMGVTLQLCEEESDAVIARAAMGISNAYILGSDSDFCFFPNVNYIPFSTLDVNGRSATAVVIRRSDLASSLGLEDSQMVELAILCGNDYLVDPTTANLDFEYPSRVRIKEIVDRLRALPQYQVSTSDPHVEEILHFVRVHYNLGDIEQFPLIDVEDEEEEERVPSADLNASYEVSMARPRVPLEVDLALAVVTPGRDVSVKDAVLRCLEAYVETAQDHAVVSRNHLEVFRALQVESQVDKSLALVKSQILPHRQDWADNVALYVIARVIAYSLKNSKSRLVQFTSPFKLFDFYQFHCMVQTSRGDMHGDVDSADLLSETKHPTVDEDDGESDLAPTAPLILPIDEHEQTILQRIRSNRVSIIQAETGAGKSSRVPVMILKAPPPDPLVPLNLFISQPRRIAAKALVERLRAVEPELKDCFALRMGHGVREYESGKTRATFVTAGYLVRLLANYPGRFDKVSHLIIDEVHERSVETDLLCLLCRRLLHENGRIRLVLMSATLASTLYQTYFDVPQPPLKVGARRFPVTEIFLDDFDSAFSLPPKIKRNITSLIAEGKRMKCKETPPLKYMEDLYPVVAHIAMIVGRPGTSVLVFVPGMNEIVAVTEEIEKLCVDGVRYNCLPIHSDIPFEDQLDAFKKPAPDEVIVIIATNAAESSVTLPAVDCVVCTGLCKQIIYSETSHRQMLMPAWISKASATQRAGRTGRLRPGTVFRLYTRENYESHMMEFEPGEMSRIPLDSVILMLKEMVTDDSVTGVLLDCLEPPNISTIDRSFQSLHRSHFITTPDDDCEVTRLGSFVSALGIDLALGSVIGLGVQMGVGAEAIQLAGVLSFPKTPWVITNPLIHDPSEYNEKTKGSYVSRCNFDAHLFSEPLGTMNMLWSYEITKNKDSWCYANFLVKSRVQRLAGSCNNLRKRVAEFFEIDEKNLRLEQPPSTMPHSKINVLRVIQVWVFHDSLIECVPKMKFKAAYEDKSFPLRLTGQSGVITDALLKQVLSSDRHPFELTRTVRTSQSASCVDLGTSPFLNGAEDRFLSFVIEKDISLLLYRDDEVGTRVYVSKELWSDKSFAPARAQLEHRLETAVTLERAKGALRGIRERPSGQWVISSKGFDGPSARRFWKFSDVSSKAKHWRELIRGFMEPRYDLKVLLVELEWKKPKAKLSEEKKKNKMAIINVLANGLPIGVSDIDLGDLFGASNVKASLSKSSSKDQTLVFRETVLATSGTGQGNKFIPRHSFTEPSWSRPVLRDCIPEGVRLLSVLASGRRREHLLRFEGDEDRTIDVSIDPSVTKLSTRWKRMDTEKAVFVSDNCVPATALPMNGKDTLYCVASNVLEVRGGGFKVEGLTLLPPGRLFLLLARLSFGLFKRENVDDSTLGDKCIRWLKQNGSLSEGDKDREASIRESVRRAVQYHQDSLDLGEELVCFPPFAERLADLFNGVDGYDAPVWDIDSSSFTRSNLEKLKRVYARDKMIRLESRSFNHGDVVAPSGQTPQPRSSVGVRDEPDEDIRELELFVQATSRLNIEDDNANRGSRRNGRVRPTSKKKKTPSKKKKPNGDVSSPFEA